MSDVESASDPVPEVDAAPPSAPHPADTPVKTVGPGGRSTLRSLATVLGLIVVALLPVAAGVIVKSFCDGSSRSLDAVLGHRDDGSPVVATALAWSQEANGPLLVGTAEGRVLRIGRNGSLQRAVVVSDGGPIMGIGPAAGLEHYDVTLDEIASQGEGVHARLFPVRRVIDGEVSGTGTNTQRGLLTVARDRAATKYVGSSRAAAAPPMQQQSLPPPAQNLLALASWAGPGSVPQAIDIGTGADLRRVAALPTSGVVVGDGGGNVVLLQARAPDEKQAANGPAATLLGRHAPPSASATGPAVVALSAAATADGAVVVASGAADHSILLWRARGPASDGETPRFEPGVSLTAYAQGSTWTRQPDVPIPAAGIIGGVYAASGNLQFGAGLGEDQRLVVRDLRSPTATSWSIPFTAREGAFAIANNGTVVQGSDTGLILYAPGRPIESIGIGTRTVARATAFDPAARILAVGFADGGIGMFDVRTGSLLRTVQPARAPVLQMAFGPDGRLLAATDADGTLVVVEVATGRSYVFDGVTVQKPKDIGFSADGLQVLVSDSADSTLRRFSVHSGRQLGSLAVAPDWLGGVSRHSGLAVRMASRTDPAQDIEVLDAVTGLVTNRIAVDASDILRTPLISDDGQRIALFEDGGSVKSWVRQAGPEQPTAMPPIADNGLRLSANGSTLLARTPSGALGIARLTGAEADRLHDVALPVAAVQADLTPDGSTVVAGCADGSIRLVAIGSDGASGGTVVLPGHGAPVDHLAVSPDGQFVATASGDGRVRITDLKRAAWVARLPLAALPSDPPLQGMTRRFLAPQAPPGSAASGTN